MSLPLALARPLLSGPSSRDLGPLFLGLARTKALGACQPSHACLWTHLKGVSDKVGGDFARSLVLASPSRVKVGTWLNH